jgi:hypothetical protein
MARAELSLKFGRKEINTCSRRIADLKYWMQRKERQSLYKKVAFG